ncbi:hypothetical protein [Algoriphagus resistens]|uniref:hypothetical protein n=1 Tax=Algoriphagus resistens TaxID=1750590 RepID=UPI000716A139|nr:hypothetical protein [Algoriphagus resistens]
MKNPFKEILEHEQLPEIIKTRVMKDINLINLSIDLADLFLVKSPDVFKTVFDDELDFNKNKSKNRGEDKDPNKNNNE